MIPVEKLIEELKKYPPDALAYAYDGEFIGIVIVSPETDGKGGDQLGAIPASEWDAVDEKYIRGKNNLSL